MTNSTVDKILSAIIIICITALFVCAVAYLGSCGNKGREYARSVADYSLKTGRSAGDIITNGR